MTEDERLLAIWDFEFLSKHWEPPTQPSTPTEGSTTWVYEDNDVPRLKYSYPTGSTSVADWSNRLDAMRDIALSERPTTKGFCVCGYPKYRDSCEGSVKGCIYGREQARRPS